MPNTWIRAEIISGLTKMMEEEFSITLEELSTKVNFNFDLLSSPNQHIPLEKVIKLLDDCAIYTQCEYFGALLASYQTVKNLGELPSVGAFAPTFGCAVTQIFNHLSLNSEGVNWQLSQDENYAYFIFNLDCPHNISHLQSIYLGMVQAFGLFKTLSNNLWKPIQANFCYPKPDNIPSFFAFFKNALPTQLYFTMDFNGFVFPKSQLTIDLSSKDDTVNNIVNDYLVLSGKSKISSKLSQIKSNMRSLLLLQKNCSLTEIAKRQNQSPRAIQYYLKKQNVSYQNLLNDIRYELACELLIESEKTIAEIANLVAFANNAVFTRSFKKQLGVTPSQYRAKNKILFIKKYN